MKMNGARLDALSMHPDDEYDCENYKRHSLMILDSECHYRQLFFKDSDTAPKVVMSKDIKGTGKMESIINYLEVNPWASLTGDTRGFTV